MSKLVKWVLAVVLAAALCCGLATLGAVTAGAAETREEYFSRELDAFLALGKQFINVVYQDIDGDGEKELVTYWRERSYNQWGDYNNIYRLDVFDMKGSEALRFSEEYLYVDGMDFGDTFFFTSNGYLAFYHHNGDIAPATNWVLYISAQHRLKGSLAFPGYPNSTEKAAYNGVTCTDNEYKAYCNYFGLPIYEYDAGDFVVLGIQPTSSVLGVLQKDTAEMKANIAQIRDELGGAFNLDLLFTSPSTTYNHALAMLGIDWSDAAYNDAAYNNRKEKLHIESELEKFYFERISPYNYSATNTKDDVQHIVAHTIASKTINVNGKSTVLITIVVRGTIGAEWYSNFDLGETIPDPAKPGHFKTTIGADHFGFSEAYANVERNLQTYIQRYWPGGFDYENSKFFITGHSRGAAIANLLAKNLTGRAKKTNVFAYTFATPNVSTSANSSKAVTDYLNIFNFVNMEDMVPYMPLAKWGYGKYGKTLYLNDDGNDNAHITAASAKYKELTGDNYIYWSSGQADLYNEFISKLKKDVPRANDYYTEPVNFDMTAYYWFHNGLAAIQAGDQTLDTLLTMSQKFGWAYYLYSAKGELNVAHDPAAYKSWLLTYGASVLNRPEPKWIALSYQCPVDIEVYNASNELVGKVVNNEVVEEATRGISVSVDGDHKNFLLPSNQAYTIKITATDNGIMEYITQNTDAATGEVLDTKTFVNVALTPGKKMTSSVGDAIATANVELLVTNNEGAPIAKVNSDGTETAITQKQYFKLWGKTTTWEKTPLNWILLVLCFGWIWMVF